MIPVIGIVPSLAGGQFQLGEEYALQVEKAGGVPVLLPPGSSWQRYASLIDALLLSGGGDLPPDYYGESPIVPESLLNLVDRRRIDFECSLVRSVLELHKPVFAVCYGMQLLNVVLEGTLWQDIATHYQPAPERQIDHRCGTHSVLIEDRSFLHLTMSSCLVNSSHHQAIRTVGKGLSVFARASDGTVEGICLDEYPFCVGVQWHPERMGNDPLSQELFRSFVLAAGECLNQ